MLTLVYPNKQVLKICGCQSNSLVQKFSFLTTFYMAYWKVYECELYVFGDHIYPKISKAVVAEFFECNRTTKQNADILLLGKRMKKSFDSFDISEESIIYCLLFVQREGCMYLRVAGRSRYLTKDVIKISYLYY